MASTDATDFRLSVLNPGGRDLEQYFDEPVGPTDTGHPPINLHAFAACTRGSFNRATKNAIAEKRPILLLLRGNFRATERALVACQKERRTIAVALKETGLHQIAKQLRDPGRLARFMRVVAQADGCIATTPEAAEIFRRVRRERDANSVAFIPTPYPLEDKQWSFIVPPNEQSGIFIGTREWDVPSRSHLSALLLAREICAGKIARPRQARTIRRLLTRGRKTQNRSATRSQPRARTGGRRRAPVPHDLRWWRRRDRPARICQFLRRRTNYCTTQDYRSRAAQEHRRARNRDYRIAMASGRAHFISGGAKTTRGVFPANWVVAAFVSNAGF